MAAGDAAVAVASVSAASGLVSAIAAAPPTASVEVSAAAEFQAALMLAGVSVLAAVAMQAVALGSEAGNLSSHAILLQGAKQRPPAAELGQQLCGDAVGAVRRSLGH